MYDHHSTIVVNSLTFFTFITTMLIVKLAFFSATLIGQHAILSDFLFSFHSVIG